VRRPDVEDYQLAVLVDSQPRAHDNEQERYVDRPRALASTGWTVAHVLAKDWLADPEYVTERLTRIVTR
jgi:very-short-patch-repair endonuclease